MTDTEHPAFHLAQPRPQGHVEALVDNLAHDIGVDAVGGHHTGQHRAVDGRIGALDVQAPGVHGRAAGMGQAVVADEDIVQTFAEDHVQGLGQSIQQVGVGGVRPIAGLVHLDDFVPGPETAGQAGSLAGFDGFGRQGVEADARREHKAFLRAGHGDVHPPFVMTIVGGGEAGNGIDQQQRRMAGGVDGTAHGGDVRGYAGAGFVMHDAHRLDAVSAVGAQVRFDH
ncbi:hypothetical protein D3C87_1435960 [compost metagenome]